MNLPVSNSRIRLSQGQLFWREIGQGQTLVFLHGSWWTGEQWNNVIPLLSPHHHCLIPDLLGFGESGQPQPTSSVATQVKGLAEFLAFLRVNECILVGQSLGAWVAATYALEYPDQIKGLVLLAPEGIDASANSPEMANRWRGYGLLASRLPLVGWTLRSLYSLAKLFGKGESLQTALRHRRYLRLAPEACQLLFRRRRTEIEAELLDDRLSALTCPLELVQGEQDDSRAIALVQSYAKAAHASITTIPGETSKTEPWLQSVRPDLVAHQRGPVSEVMESTDDIRHQFTQTFAPRESSREHSIQPSPMKLAQSKAAKPQPQRQSVSPSNAIPHRPLDGAIAYVIKDFIDQHRL